MGKTSNRLNELCHGKNKFGLEVVKRLYIIGKSQNWLADQCGVSKQYISQIIYGKCRPSAKVTEQLAKIFEMDVQELRKLVLKAS